MTRRRRPAEEQLHLLADPQPLLPKRMTLPTLTLAMISSAVVPLPLPSAELPPLQLVLSSSFKHLQCPGQRLEVFEDIQSLA